MPEIKCLKNSRIIDGNLGAEGRIGYDRRNAMTLLERLITLDVFSIKPQGWGCGRFFVPSYAAQPSLRRYSSGLSHPSERLILPEQ